MAEGFLRASDRDRLHVQSDVDVLIDVLVQRIAGAGVKGLLAQLRLVFDAPPEAPGLPDGQAHVSPMAPRLVRHPRARQYVLRVLPDGTPRVTIPRWGSKREALAFLEAQRAWVARQRAKQAERARIAPSREWVDGHSLLLGGRAVTLRQGAARRAGVVAGDDVLVMTPRPGTPRICGRWPRRGCWRGRNASCRRGCSLAARFDLAVTHVLVRNQRARWGSCATGGRISLNWRLVQTPDAVRDYVLIHELMHLRQPNPQPLLGAGRPRLPGLRGLATMAARPRSGAARRPLTARRPSGTVSLDRALSKLGMASRSGARALIVEGRVTVDGRVVRDAGLAVVPERVRIAIDGEAREAAATLTVLLHSRAAS